MNLNNSSVWSLVLLVAISLSILSHGCGSLDESTQSSQSVTNSTLEQTIDSLASENRRLRQQVDAITQENRNLASRYSELEMKLAEAMKQKTPPTPANLNAAYEAALNQYQQKNFNSAVAQFETILTSSKGFELADNCHYWTGECYYAMRRYKDAIDHFQAVFDYVHAKKKADAQFMIGNCQLALGNKVGAITAFAKVVNNHPTSDLVKPAEEKLGRIR